MRGGRGGGGVTPERRGNKKELQCVMEKALVTFTQRGDGGVDDDETLWREKK